MSDGGLGGGAPSPQLSFLARAAYALPMIQRSDIIWLGISAAVTGSLVGGLMLGIGLGMVVNRIWGGFVFIIPGAPVSGLVGWLLARRLAAQLRD